MIPTAMGAHHLGFNVPDLDFAIAWYERVMGAEVVFLWGPFEDPEGTAIADKLHVHPRTSVKGAILRLGATFNVELVEWHSPDEATAPPHNNYLGATHFAIRVADLDAAVAVLQKLLEEREIIWLGTPGPMADGQPHTGLRNVFFETPFGQLIELDEYGQMPYERFTTARVWNAGTEPWSNSHPTDAAPPPPGTGDAPAFPGQA